MISNISYTGKVTVKVTSKPPVKRKNAGTNVLFNMLRDVLAGDLNFVSRPASIQIIYKDEKINDMSFEENPDFDAYKNNTIVTGRLEITGKDKLSDGRLKLTALLSYGQLTDAVLNSQTYYVLLLDGNENILAYISISNNDLMPVYENLNGQAVIEWELSFGNATTGGE